MALQERSEVIHGKPRPAIEPGVGLAAESALVNVLNDGFLAAPTQCHSFQKEIAAKACRSKSERYAIKPSLFRETDMNLQLLSGTAAAILSAQC